jgi:large subunit ribosomal protein L17
MPMRHQKAGYKLGRPTHERNALYRSLMLAIVEHERITTTHVKAKAVQRHIEKLITLSREPSVHHRRLALATLPNKHAVEKLFAQIGPRYVDRPGGYTRITKMGVRKGDGTLMAQIELV